MASCGKENNNLQIENKGTYEFTISAITEDAECNDNALDKIMTKTAYSGETAFSWTLGDQISVLFHDAGDNNAFYTLTATSVDGKNATFRGTIDSGWEIGAADTGDKWALFPAGSHSYTATAPVFNLAASTDFSASHFSANLPLYAIGEDNGAGTDVYSFKHIYNVGAYKITFNNLDVSKVRLDIETSGSYHISGDFQLTLDGSNYKISPWTYSWSSEAGKRVSFTENVVSEAASFYVPFKTWEANFEPMMTLYDASTGYTIKTVTANSALPYTTGNVVVLQPFSAPGSGSPLYSVWGVDWASIDMYPLDGEKDCFPGDGERIAEWKVTSDATYIYFYYKTVASVAVSRGVWESYLVTGYDTDNDSSSGDAASYGLGDGFEARTIAYPFSNNAGNPVSFYSPASPCSSSKSLCPIGDGKGASLGTIPTNGSLLGDYAYVETRVPRSYIGSPASGVTIRVRQAYGSTSCAAQTITLY